MTRWRTEKTCESNHQNPSRPNAARPHARACRGCLKKRRPSHEQERGSGAAALQNSPANRWDDRAVQANGFKRADIALGAADAIAEAVLRTYDRGVAEAGAQAGVLELVAVLAKS